MEEQLISVIVPVYNVAEYLEECYQSIVSQTYKNLEIIFVDDGSTDDSGRLCDKFVEKDCRVHTIHKANGGLSSARNAGLKIASGDIISFIDSDDYPRNDMFEKLFLCMTKYQVDIVCCDYSSSVQRQILSGEIKLLKSNQAISLLLDNSGYRCYAWNKLYKKNLFEDIKYPEGELFEDIKTTYKLFKKVSEVCYLREDLYFYRIRESSITGAKFTSRNREVVNAINAVRDDAYKWLDRAEFNRFIVGYIFYYISFVKKALIAKMEISPDVLNLKKCIQSNIKNILKSDGIGMNLKLEIILFGVSPKVFEILLKKKNNGEKNG